MLGFDLMCLKYVSIAACKAFLGIGGWCIT